MSDYTYYQNRLGGDAFISQEPQPGRWRVPASKTKSNSKSYPVAIWPDESGRLVVKIAQTLIHESDAEDWHKFACETWLRCATNPISEEVYNSVIETGIWPDEHAAVTGHNKAPADDSFEGLRDKIDELKREAEKLIKKGAAKTQDESDQASDLANALGAAEKKALAQKKIEKDPIIELGRNVEAKWLPLSNDADEFKKALKSKVIGPFLNAQQAKAEKITKETGVKVEVKTTSGSRGRSVSLRTVKKGNITDYDKFLLHLKGHAKVKELMQTLADSAARQGLAMPGMEIIETKEAA